MAVNFVPNPNKPHIRLLCCYGEYFIWTTLHREHESIKDWCLRVNPREYTTAGEASRAWHNYREE
jgi:hypothetical protein